MAMIFTSFKLTLRESDETESRKEASQDGPSLGLDSPKGDNGFGTSAKEGQGFSLQSNRTHRDDV
jgi:hypothetical protein